MCVTVARVMISDYLIFSVVEGNQSCKCIYNIVDFRKWTMGVWVKIRQNIVDNMQSISYSS